MDIDKPVRFDKFYINEIELDIYKDIELWADINGFQSRYQISNFGRVRNKRTNKFLKPSTVNGYYYVSLYINTVKSKTMTIHSLVAKNFIFKNNPHITEEKLDKCIDHIDENKLNNKVDNLQWISYSENTKRSIKYENHYRYKDILQYDITGTLIKKWQDINKIIEENPTFKKDNLLKCLSNKSKSAYGFKWKHEIEAEENEILHNNEVFKCVGKINLIDFSKYEVSNYGQVRNTVTNKYIKLRNTDGYLSARLHHNNKEYCIGAHRLVALVFIKGRTKEKKFVNHIDEDRGNNYYKNLEWLTHKDNIVHSIGKRVSQIDRNTGEIIKTFRCMTDAAKATGAKPNTISICCSGKISQTHGYGWRYA